LTQDEVAKAAGISRVAYRDLEAGQVKDPKVSTLNGLAQAYQVGVEELLRTTPTLKRVRFRSTKQMKNREQILADVDQWLKDFIEVEELLDDGCDFELSHIHPAIEGNSVDRLIRAKDTARMAREALGLNQKEPVRDICGLLEAAGVKVYPIKAQTDAFFGLSIGQEDGGPAVVVNTWDKISVERWIFSAAHELGHLLLHLGAYNVDEMAESPEEEKEADCFAAQFLMPDHGFDNEGYDAMGLGLVDRVLKVKRIYRVSYKTVLFRLDQKSKAKPGWKPQDSVFMRFQATYKRSHGQGLSKAEEPEALAAEAFKAREPDHLLPSDFSEDRLRTLVRRSIEKNLITLSRGAEILRVPLVEMRDLTASWV
jgi:Zn-dependent peptidase ImmA (M78 family)/DNA-binding XRE family transcriptional regulator